MDALRWVILGAAVIVAVVGIILFASVDSASVRGPIREPVGEPETTTSTNTSQSSSNNTQSSTPSNTTSTGTSTTAENVSGILVIADKPVSQLEFDLAYATLVENYARFYQQFEQDFTQQLEGESGAYYQLELRSQLVDQLVRETLIANEIERRNIAVAQADIEAEFNTQYSSILEQNELSEDQADEILKQQGSSLAQFKQELRDQVSSDLRQQQLVDAVTGEVTASDFTLINFAEESSFVYIDLLATDAEVPTAEEERAYYDTHTQDYLQLKARHILIRVDEGAPDAEVAAALSRTESLRADILGGADFSEVAKASSEDTASGAQGGDLGYFGEGVMVRSFEEAAFSLAVGELSEPVRSPFGFHLILVDEQRAQPFEEVAEEIGFQLFQERREAAFEAFLNRAKSGQPDALAALREAVESDYVDQQRTDMFEEWFAALVARTEIQINMPLVVAYRLEAVDLQLAIDTYEQIRSSGQVQDGNIGYYICQVYVRRSEQTQTRIDELEIQPTLSATESDELSRLKGAIGLYEVQASSCS